MSGDELKKKLDGVGISYAELARQLGVFPQSFNKTLKSKDVGSGVLENIAKIIGKDMNFFYEMSVQNKEDLAIQFADLKEENDNLNKVPHAGEDFGKLLADRDYWRDKCLELEKEVASLQSRLAKYEHIEKEIV